MAKRVGALPNETECAHSHRLQVSVPVEVLAAPAEGKVGCTPHLLVISKVVPKIWARTNSAMVNCGVCGLRQAQGGGVEGSGLFWS